jgi:hypothetical protein
MVGGKNKIIIKKKRKFRQFIKNIPYAVGSLSRTYKYFNKLIMFMY